MIEYKEIVKRGDGKRIVFCRLEELIKEAYGVKDIAQAQDRVIRGEYIVHCPFCKNEGHRKHKLYIKDDLTIGNCFVCGRAFVNIDDNVDTDYRIPKFLDDMYQNEFKVVPIPDESMWSLSKFHLEFDDYSERGIDYLKGRHRFLGELWRPLGFKFLNDNVVMPFIYHGEVIYYQIRFIDATAKDDVRYFFPPMPPGTKPPYIIENGDRKKFIIVEGIYDAIAALIQAPDYTPFAVLGSTITDYQMNFLREYMPEKILIWMDETSISMKIRNILSPVINYCPINIIPSDGPDPEEVMKLRIRRGLPLQWIPSDYGEKKSIMFPRINIKSFNVSS